VNTLETTLPLSKIDVDILKTLEAEGAKTSTRDLSKILDVPDRTIRYRISRLKEKKLLRSLTVQTYERKLGLAEKVLFIRSVPSKEAELEEIFAKIPILYHYASTYGRYEGFTVYSMFPMSYSHMITRIINELKDAGLIEDYYEFELVDYTRKGVDIDAFLEGSTWTWQTWYDEITKVIETHEKIDLGFEEFPQVASFDFMDIQIIMNMVENAEITLKELSDILNLSQPQVHKRIKNLESNGIIRGYKPSFMPFEGGTGFSIIFKSQKHAQEILCALHKLPFFIVFSMESKNHYFVSLSIPSSDMNSFLQGINKLKRYADEFFIQTTICHTHKGHLHLLSTYNQDTKQWDIPMNEYVEMIRNLSEK